jgi:hypothetical protein
MGKSHWLDRDVPVLRAVARAHIHAESSDVESLCADTGFERPVVEESVKDLKFDYFIDGVVLSMWPFEMGEIQPTGKGLRAAFLKRHLGL